MPGVSSTPVKGSSNALCTLAMTFRRLVLHELHTVRVGDDVEHCLSELTVRRLIEGEAKKLEGNWHPALNTVGTSHDDYDVVTLEDDHIYREYSACVGKHPDSDVGGVGFVEANYLGDADSSIPSR